MASTVLYVAFGKWLLDSGMTVPGIHDPTPAEAWIYFSWLLSMKDFFEGMLFPEFRWNIPDIHVGCVIFSTTDTGDEFINGSPATIAFLPYKLWSKYTAEPPGSVKSSAARWWDDDLETVLSATC